MIEMFNNLFNKKINQNQTFYSDYPESFFTNNYKSQTQNNVVIENKNSYNNFNTQNTTENFNNSNNNQNSSIFNFNNLFQLLPMFLKNNYKNNNIFELFNNFKNGNMDIGKLISSLSTKNNDEKKQITKTQKENIKPIIDLSNYEEIE